MDAFHLTTIYVIYTTIINSRFFLNEIESNSNINSNVSPFVQEVIILTGTDIVTTSVTGVDHYIIKII